MLEVKDLDVAYGESHVVHGVSFSVEKNTALAIMGRNGMGKTTVMKALIGMLPARRGSVRLDGRDLSKLPSYERAHAGIGFVPQGRMIFSSLTVEENIMTGLENQPRRVIPSHVYDFFPVLKEMRKRRGGNLSYISFGSYMMPWVEYSGNTTRSMPGRPAFMPTTISAILRAFARTSLRVCRRGIL